MVENFREAVVFATTVGAGVVFGGYVLRHFGLKWIKDREEFERRVNNDFKAAVDSANGRMDMIRSEGLEARDSLRKEAEVTHRAERERTDYEIKILRDRWHALDTLTQRLVDRITIVDDSVKKLTVGQEALTAAIHGMDLTIANRFPATAKE